MESEIVGTVQSTKAPPNTKAPRQSQDHPVSITTTLTAEPSVHTGPPNAPTKTTTIFPALATCQSSTPYLELSRAGQAPIPHVAKRNPGTTSTTPITLLIMNLEPRPPLNLKTLNPEP